MGPLKGLIGIIRDFFRNGIGIVFLKFWVWVKELSIFDLRFGFYAKNYPYGQFPSSKLANPGQHLRKSGNVVFALSKVRFVSKNSV